MQRFSYFGLRLQTYLHNHFPDKEKDTPFIRSRADLAAIAYEQALLDGYSHQGAEEKATKVLFEGLHFSPYDTLVEVLCNEFDDKVPEALIAPFALLLLVMTRKIFAKYPLTDTFAYTPDYEGLYTELTGAILTIIEKNGLQ